MRKLIIVMLLLVVTLGYAQGTPANNDTDIYSTAELQVLPEYPGGISELYAFVTNNLRVPDVTEDMKVNIPLTFVVNQDGTVSNIKVLRDPGHGLAEEAVRMMASNTEVWKPGRLNGKPVRVRYMLPIKINITGNDEEKN